MRPPLEFPARLTDDPEGIGGSVWIPNEVIAVFLRHLYIVRYEREFFTVILQGATPIRLRVGYEPEKMPDGGLEWTASGLLLVFDTYGLESWIYHFRPQFYEDRSRMVVEMALSGKDVKTGKRLDLEVRIGQPRARRRGDSGCERRQGKEEGRYGIGC
jgi:hypothetical protein